MNSWMQVYLSDERQVRLLHGLGVANVGLYQVIERSLMSLTAEMVAHSNAEQSTHSAVDATTHTDSAQHTPLPLPSPSPSHASKSPYSSRVDSRLTGRAPY